MLAISFFESFVAAVGHPPLQKKSLPSLMHVYTCDIAVSMSCERAEHFRTTYKASILPCLLVGDGSILPLHFTLYETLQMCVLRP